MRIGIIGLKGHYSECLHALPQLKGARIVAVSDDRPEVAKKFCATNEHAKDAEAYTDWRHLVEHSMLDVCVVSDENGWRAEQVMELAKRGVHVCAEKPLTTTLDDLKRVRTALAESMSKLTMLLTMRHLGKYARMHELIAAGAIAGLTTVMLVLYYGLTRVFLAMRAFESGDHEEAQRWIDELLVIGPRDPDILLLAAENRLQLKDPEGALSYYQRALAGL